MLPFGTDEVKRRFSVVAVVVGMIKKGEEPL